MEDHATGSADNDQEKLGRASRAVQFVECDLCALELR